MNGPGICGRVAAVGAVVLVSATSAACICEGNPICLPEPVIAVPPSSDVPGGPQTRTRSGADSADVDWPDLPLPRRVRLADEELFAAVREVLAVVDTAQERARGELGAYTTDVGRLLPAGTGAVQLRIESASTDAWSASATRSELKGLSCVVTKSRVGAPPQIYTQRERRAGHTNPGTIICDSAVR